MLLVVEECDVPEDLELLHHVTPVKVQTVDVLDELGNVVGHGREFRTGTLVTTANPLGVSVAGARASLRRAPNALAPQLLSAALS